MYLMGQFIKDVAPPDVKDDLDFFRFPIIDGNLGLRRHPNRQLHDAGKCQEQRGRQDIPQIHRFEGSARILATELGRLAANKHVPHRTTTPRKVWK